MVARVQEFHSRAIVLSAKAYFLAIVILNAVAAFFVRELPGPSSYLALGLFVPIHLFITLPVLELYSGIKRARLQGMISMDAICSILNTKRLPSVVGWLISGASFDGSNTAFMTRELIESRSVEELAKKEDQFQRALKRLPYLFLLHFAILSMLGIDAHRFQGLAGTLLIVSVGFPHLETLGMMCRMLRVILFIGSQEVISTTVTPSPYRWVVAITVAFASIYWEPVESKGDLVSLHQLEVNLVESKRESFVL